MSEKINLIPANELPVAEGDEVSVLCLENGEMKQKPASGLGGDNYDAVIKVEEWYNETDDENGVTFTLEKGTYGDLVGLISSGVAPRVLIHGILWYGGDFPYAEVINHGVVDGEQICMRRTLSYAVDSPLFIHPDNTVDIVYR